MRLLFVHPNMPGQFKHLARHYGAVGGCEVRFITRPRPNTAVAGVIKHEYAVRREPSPQIHRYLHHVERGILQGQEAYRAARVLKQQGFTPDVIVAHPGWGDTLFLRDLWPESPQLHFCEFYYRASGADVGFDPETPVNEDDLARIRIKNTVLMHSLMEMDAGYAPTHWQHRQFPERFQPDIAVVHDGIDMETCTPNAAARFQLPDGRTLSRDDVVVSYVARNLEPYRGFPSFMQAAAELLKRHPKLHIVAVGADGVSYGKPAPKGTSYRQIWQKKLPDMDMSRLHFTGMVPYDQLLQLFCITRAHVYLTYPFVLSWSMLEAMACGAPVVGSSTAPVEEVIQHGNNGWLVDFFNPSAVAEAVSHALAAEEERRAVGEAARATVAKHYELSQCMGRQIAMIERLAHG